MLRMLEALSHVVSRCWPPDTSDHRVEQRPAPYVDVEQGVCLDSRSVVTRSESSDTPTSAVGSCVGSVCFRRTGSRCSLNVLLIALGIRVWGQKLQLADAENVFRFGRHSVTKSRAITVFVCGLLSVIPVRHLVSMAVPPVSEIDIFDVATELLLPAQYILSVVYFAHSHIEMFKDVTRPYVPRLDTNYHHGRRLAPTSSIRDVFVDISTQLYNDSGESVSVSRDRSFEFETLVRQPCRLTVRRMTWLVCVVSIVIFAVFVATKDFAAYGREYGLTFVPFLIASRLVGSLVLCLNSITFCFVFYKHVKVLKIYADILQTQRWDVARDHRISVVLVNLVRIRDSLHISQELMGGVFSTATVSGAVALGIFIHSASHSVHTPSMWTALGSFVLLQTAFFSVIYRLNKAKSSIENLVHSGKFASLFLSRRPLQTAEARTLETATTVDWKIITDLLREQWISFSVLGMPLHSAGFIKQVVAATGLLVLYLRPAEMVAG
jgi:hypothetical protein